MLELPIYDFEIKYRSSSQMGNADFCSRFPLDQPVPNCLDSSYVNSLNFSNEFPVDISLVIRETKTDLFLSQLIEFIVNGWPKKVARSFLDIYSCRDELEMIDGIVLYKERVVIPASMQLGILKLLHANHYGIVR